MAFSTEVTRTLWSGSDPRDVLAERCIMSPMSLPYPLCPQSTIPLCIKTAFAPPLATSSMVSVISMIPGTGPMETPWSMGTITLFPVFRSMILSILIVLPIMHTPPNILLPLMILIFYNFSLKFMKDRH